MSDDRAGNYFVDDFDDDLDDDLLTAPVVLPASADTDEPIPAPPVAAPAEVPESTPVDRAKASESVVAEEPRVPDRDQAPPPVRVPAGAEGKTREQRLADALNALMGSNPDIQASALVSMDGFIMASALPPDLQEDRVGAMSAAILGLGERAASELGRGRLEQVYIEGDEGIVVLISAGGRAVLTALADADARLGLVLFDMQSAAEAITEALG